jgi:hypothetical protein
MKKKIPIATTIYISPEDITKYFGSKELLKDALKLACLNVIEQAQIKAENKAI